MTVSELGDRLTAPELQEWWAEDNLRAQEAEKARKQAEERAKRRRRA